MHEIGTPQPAVNLRVISPEAGRELQRAEQQRHGCREGVQIDAGGVSREAGAHARLDGRAERQEGVDDDGVGGDADGKEPKQRVADDSHGRAQRAASATFLYSVCALPPASYFAFSVRYAVPL